MTRFNTNQRFFDLQQETLQTLSSIQGYEDMPLVSLKMAVQNLESSTFKIMQNAHIATEESAQSHQQLTQDEAAAIYLYTMPSSKQCQQSLCAQLNNLLRSEDRTQLVPYYLYLKLFFSALWKLKSVKKTVWRGVKADVHNQYPVGEHVVWWGFSSCLESLEEIQSEKFIGKTGTRTLFQIECETGKQIKSYSYDQDINEVVLLPGTHFEVLSHAYSKNGLYMIRMKEIESSYSLLQSSPLLPVRSEKKAHSAPTSIITETSHLSSYVSDMQKYHSSNASLAVTNVHNKIVKSAKSYENKQLKEQINADRKKESIRFSKQLLNYDDMQMIANELTTNKYWKMIYLWEDHMNDRHMTILMNGLKMNTTVISLSLDQNSLGDEGACVLANVLKQNSSLRTIYLNKNGIGDIGGEAIADMLHVNRTLMDLEFSSNEISDQGVIAITDALKVNKHLRTLCLNNNKFTHIGAQHLGHMLEINQTLTDLQISSNNIGDDGASAIIDALQNNQTLKSIHLGQTMITTKTMQKIEEMLSKNSTLKCLHLNNNDLGDVALKIIIPALKKNTTLTTLDLSMNDLTKRSAHEIGTLLKQTNSRLQTLMLSNNRLGDDGIGCIARALIDNQSLVKLVIEDVQMKSSGANELSQMLNVNESLEYLVLNNNEIDDECMRLISSALENNRSLKYLYLNNCNMKDESIRWITKIMETNGTLTTLEMVKNHLTERGKMVFNKAQTLNGTCSIYLDFTFHCVH